MTDMTTDTDTTEHSDNGIEVAERTTAEQFRAELRTVLKPMSAPERQTFLEHVGPIARAAEQRGTKWYFNMATLIDASTPLGRVDAFRRLLLGALTMTPLYRTGPRAQLDLIIDTMRGM